MQQLFQVVQSIDLVSTSQVLNLISSERNRGLASGSIVATRLSSFARRTPGVNIKISGFGVQTFISETDQACGIYY